MTDPRLAEALARAEKLAASGYVSIAGWAEAVRALRDAKDSGCIPDIKQASIIGDMSRAVNEAITTFCNNMLGGEE